MKINFLRLTILCLAVAILLDCKKPLDDALYAKAFREVEAGAVKPNRFGIAHLPPDLASLSLGGKIYVSTLEFGNQLVVIFKTTEGKGGNMDGFLYAATPILSDQTYREDGRPVVTIRFPPHNPSDFRDVFWPDELFLDEQLTTHLYRVSFWLD